MSSERPRRLGYRHRIIGLGAVIAVVLYVIGGFFYLRGVEHDLENRVPQAIAEGGYGEVEASFSGQDGRVICETPLDDPVAAEEVAASVWGVHQVELDPSCRVRTETTPVATSVVDPDDSFESVVDVLDSNPQFELVARLAKDGGLDDLIGADAEGPVTLFAPTVAAFDSLPAEALARLDADPSLIRRILEHHMVEGQLRSADLADGPLDALDGSTHTVATGPPVMIDAATVTEADLVAQNGVVHAIDRVLLPDDIDLTTPVQRETTTTAAATTPPTTTPPTTDNAAEQAAEQAVEVEAALNGYVAANPILFSNGSDTLDPASGSVLDEIARQLGELEAMTIVVHGHTDSYGNDDNNLALSQQRADAVKDALIERGVNDESLTAVGHGESEPIIVDGDEDHAASRRVVFEITAS